MDTLHALRAACLALLVPSLSLAAAPKARPALVLGRQVVFSPQAGRLETIDGKALPRSALYSDSKSQAYNLDRQAVVKFYTGGYGKGDAAKAEELGRHEIEVVRALAREGLADPVLDADRTEDGVAYAVFARPKRGVSPATLAKKGRLGSEALAKIEQLTRALTEKLWRLETLNPAQLYLGDDGRMRVIKAYADDRRVPDSERAQLERHYEARRELIAAVADVYPGLRRRTPLADAEPARAPADIARTVAEALRSERPVHLIYENRRGETGDWKVKLLPESPRSSSFLKGFVSGEIYPKPGASNKPYLFRLERIQEAQLLGENALAPKIEYVRLPRAWQRLQPRRAFREINADPLLYYWPPHGTRVAIPLVPEVKGLIRAGAVRVYRQPREQFDAAGSGHWRSGYYIIFPRGSMKATEFALSSLHHAAEMFAQSRSRLDRLMQAARESSPARFPKAKEEATAAIARMQKSLELYERRRREFGTLAREAMDAAPGRELGAAAATILGAAVGALGLPDGTDTLAEQTRAQLAVARLVYDRPEIASVERGSLVSIRVDAQRAARRFGKLDGYETRLRKHLEDNGLAAAVSVTVIPER